MDIYSIKDKNIDNLCNQVFNDNGELKILPAKFYQNLNKHELFLLSHKKAIYNFPTIELVEWLKYNFNLNNAIEIASGNGALARALDITATDIMLQENKFIKKYYESIGQPVIKYGKNVLQYSSTNAIIKFKPSVVIGCWCTQIYDKNTGYGSAFGIDEEFILNHVDTYIHIGNSKIHGNKKILTEYHTEFKTDWLISRSRYYNDNVIYIWENEK